MTARTVIGVWLGRACVAMLVFALLGLAAARAQAPFSVSGGGGTIPASGTGGGGTWAYTMPASSGTALASTPVPADACVISEVRILGLMHSWIGDLQIVLVSPSGRRTNLVVRPGYTGTGYGNAGDCTGGTYSIVDAYAPGAASVPTSGDWSPGTYAQSFGVWPSGSASITNTVLESVAAETGVWGLEIYDWEGGDTGSFTGWELHGIRGIPVSLSGPGGAIPAAGTGGIGGAWPGTFPVSPQVSQCEYAPPGFLKMESVEIDGLTHTWCGDVQIALLRSDGIGLNLAHRPGFIGFGTGSSDDCTGGTYRFVEPGNPSGAIVPSVGNWNAGTYQQSFGTWPSGTSSVYNEPITRFHASAGRWTLAIWDWAGGDVGSFTSWRLNGYFVPVGPAYFPSCPGGLTSNGCVAGMTAANNPSVTNAYSCYLDTVNVEGARNGLIFYGIYGPVSLPFGDSTMCVKTPTQRTPVQSSGGAAGTCNGVFSLDWNAYRLANPYALGQPFHVGSTLMLQAWFRDPPAPGGTNLSSALMVTHMP